MSTPGEGRSHPLRPYYSSTDENAAFVATAPRFQSNAGSNSTSGSSRGGSFAPAGLSSSRYASANDDATLNEAIADLNGGGGGVKDWARSIAISAAFGYTSTCLAMPFEVGKLLLQIQWVPRDEVWVAFGDMEREDEMVKMNSLARSRGNQRRSGSPTSRRSAIGRNEWNEGEESDEGPDDEDLMGGSSSWADEGGSKRDFGGEQDELSDEDDAEAYFRDLSDQSGRPTNLTNRTERQKRKKTDSSGYVMRKSVHEDTTRPEFVMPVVVRGGVWEMIKAVGRGKEGWLGLWKGSLTTFVIDTVTQTVQPFVSFVLSFAVPSALTPLPLPYAPYPLRSLSLLLASHLVTGVIVSPLDLVRTRLIAQSTLPPHRKYNSPWNALQQILHEEGGWRTVYFHPNLFIPTVLDFTVRPLLSLGAPLFIEHRLRLDPMTSPVRYSLAEFCISTASLLVTLPIETVRRRLQLQARAAWGKKISKVHGSRPKPNHRSSGSASTLSSLQGQEEVQKSPSSRSERKDMGNTFFASVTGAIPQPIFSKPLRTCVETRPKPYEGVAEAIYRILTEETSITPAKKIGKGSKPGNTEPVDLKDSGILAKPGSSTFGGLYSLYRGLGFSIGANALVFVLTIVTGERTHGTAGWTEI
ncbi:mitochondrial carrier [Meira miltonrushii]|uniref:Mitochondrial carrier n=1 Tax=Meira miltonrushii TaxID=1280837 RepID=A0A316VL12_9BASI|nr:mitochondrial carrier [Meira miltonrushii]PWN38292.1 mitochondrial carrier [Meira miltonrushii]